MADLVHCKALFLFDYCTKESLHEIGDLRVDFFGQLAR